MPVGIVRSNLSPQAFLGVFREHILLPLASSTTYFVAASDISAATAGTALTRATAGALPLRGARLPNITSVDNSGTNLSVTVRLVGRRFGRQVVQDITATGSGGGQTVAGTKCIDELVSATIIAVSNNTTSDTVAVGFDGTRLGLFYPIKSVKSVKFIEKIAAGSPSSANIKAGATVQVSTIVKVADSSVDVNALYSGNVAATDRYIIDYVCDGLDEFLSVGRYA